jgi:hypothetical protein
MQPAMAKASNQLNNAEDLHNQGSFMHGLEELARHNML